ncbi:hypothetical protein DFH07DRAFT_770576 [Mycena maculata]|uniref:Uncharacterized protein n=1 Tax=Mycena maculata TaxID=230809 RepID=A0AAD7NJW0_9AGAR|nr:hypothetical protein DFH07DRAFT_770576 [Mycena maculata]
MVTTRRDTYASVASTPRTSRKTLAEEAAEVGASFEEAPVITAEGELQFGSLPAVDQNALSVPSSPRMRRSDIEEYLEVFQSQNREDEQAEEVQVQMKNSDSDSEESFESTGATSLELHKAVDWNTPEGTFIVPKVTAKKVYEWNKPVKMEYKFFPSWFDLSDDEDQLGPIPEWDTAINRALPMEEGPKVSSMAVIVEVSEKTPDKSNEGQSSGKGKGIAAGERSKAFATLLKQMEKAKKAESKKKTAAGSSNKKSRTKAGSQPKFDRPASQVPGGGWFGATTSGNGSPPDPPSSSSSDSSDDRRVQIPRPLNEGGALRQRSAANDSSTPSGVENTGIAPHLADSPYGPSAPRVVVHTEYRSDIHRSSVSVVIDLSCVDSRLVDTLSCACDSARRASAASTFSSEEYPRSSPRSCCGDVGVPAMCRQASVPPRGSRGGIRCRGVVARRSAVLVSSHRLGTRRETEVQPSARPETPGARRHSGTTKPATHLAGGSSLLIMSTAALNMPAGEFDVWLSDRKHPSDALWADITPISAQPVPAYTDGDHFSTLNSSVSSKAPTEIPTESLQVSVLVAMPHAPSTNTEELPEVAFGLAHSHYPSS